MKLFRFISTICCLATISVAASGANTTQSFQGDFPDLSAIPSPSILTTLEGEGTAPIVVDGWSGQALRLTHDLENGQNNSVAFNRLIPGEWSSMEVNLDIRVDGEGAHADGYGFGLLNTANYGKTTATPTPGWSPEEPNLTNSFGVGFDTFHNDGLDPLPGVGADLPNSVSLHYNGAVVEQLLTSDMMDADGDFLGEDWLQSGNPISMNIALSPVADGMNATITMLDTETDQVVVPFQNVLIPGMTAYESRMAFRGRTGGADSNQEIDNISYQISGGPQVTIDDFESYEVDEEIPNEVPEIPKAIPVGGGTPYTISNYGQGADAELVIDGGLPGVQDGHLQLSRTVGGQHNFVAFDKTSDQTERIEAAFKFRVLDSGNNADGFGVALVDTAEYGDEGELTEGAAPWTPAEAPNLIAGLGLGFDTYDNDEEGFIDDDGCGDGALCVDRRANHISLHWDGLEESDLFEEEGFLDREEFDLVNEAWNDAVLTVERDGNDSLVSLVITDGTDGSVHTVYDNFRINGMSFDGGARFAAGARTGGAFSFQSIDEINIDFGDGDPCDFDGDGVLGVGDINAIAAEIQAGTNNAAFDLSGDGIVDAADLTAFVGGADKLNTWIGDSNLDGEFNSSDFVVVFGIGKFETGEAATWAEGDWNGDGVFGSGDFVAAFTDGGFEIGPKAAAQQVPEPSSIVLVLLATCGLIVRRHN